MCESHCENFAQGCLRNGWDKASGYIAAVFGSISSTKIGSANAGQIRWVLMARIICEQK